MSRVGTASAASAALSKDFCVNSHRLSSAVLQPVSPHRVLAEHLAVAKLELESRRIALDAPDIAQTNRLGYPCWREHLK